MKKSFFILAIILVINQNIFSQDAERKFTIQVSPMLWFIDIFSADTGDILFAMDLEGQLKLTNSTNLSLTLSFLLSDYTVIYEYYYGDIYYDYKDDYKEKIYQISIKPMFVYRPFETGLRGFYLGFYPNIGLLHVENDYKNQFYAEFGFGINVGYKWIFRNGFTMQLGGGIGKTFSIPEGSKRYIDINSDGSIPLTHTDIHLLDFKLGYSF